MNDIKAPSSQIEANKQIARHLAARAVVALRAKFRVERLALADLDERSSGITCNWKQAREPYGDDTKLVKRGFAFVYVGTIVDQRSNEPLSDPVVKELNSDMSSAQEAREAAVQWGLVPSLMDTNPFAHVGYKLASRLIRADEDVINRLAEYLLEQRIVEEQQLSDWFERHATPLSLEEMEQSITY
jgi:hypothetical protein